MALYQVYAVIKGTKFLGTFDASTAGEAQRLALAGNTAHIKFCRQCEDQCEDPVIDYCDVEPAIGINEVNRG